jgi:hypothetical protein
MEFSYDILETQFAKVEQNHHRMRVLVDELPDAILELLARQKHFAFYELLFGGRHERQDHR